MLTLPTSSGGRRTHSYFEKKNHLLISLMMGPISKLVVSYMCFINNSFMLRFISKLVVGSGLIHFSSPIWKFFDLSPHFISSSLLDSAAAVFIQFVPVGHLLSFFHFCPYFLSYCIRFFSIDQGCTTFDELTKKVTLFPCFLLSSVGSLGRTHIIGLLKGEWCIGEYYFGFQRDFKFRPVEIYIIMILDPHHLCHPGHVEHLPV